ncbi:hypothetical protein E6O75_ATG00740 [Venturia nashicola]|uniref:Uncharacterized protein n=1 Tax=Venturia nashicola TaxID=86259 RepID=A0A4Z1PGA5_9PEZI|nr:hypothetical protein E6O75_ATG00740 [Venturia nashicola]
MRLRQTPSLVLSLVPSLVSLLLASQPVAAGPFSKFSDLVPQSLRDTTSDSTPLNHTLELRTVCGASQITCGFYGQLCCDAGNTCGTNAANQAICVAGSGAVTAVAGSGAGAWQYYTSTFVENVGVVTRTTVYSSWVPGAVATTVPTAAAGTCSPNYANNETPCGPICCASGQYCYSLGVCKSAGAGGFTTTGVGAGAPVRPTTISGMITTQTISPTTTVPFQTPIAASSTGNGTVIATSSHSGLSGGAIAGIVIGVVAGLILLSLLLFCCCLKEAAAGILAIFGLGGGKKKTRRVVEEEYVSSHHRHGSGAGSERRWYGAGGSRPGSRPARPAPKKSGVGGLGAMGLGLGGLAVALGLKRKHDKKHEEKSDISSGYYGSSYYGSNSSSKVIPSLMSPDHY